jgi:hypothetical protein
VLRCRPNRSELQRLAGSVGKAERAAGTVLRDAREVGDKVEGATALRAEVGPGARAAGCGGSVARRGRCSPEPPARLGLRAHRTCGAPPLLLRLRLLPAPAPPAAACCPRPQPGRPLPAARWVPTAEPARRPVPAAALQAADKAAQLRSLRAILEKQAYKIASKGI